MERFLVLAEVPAKKNPDSAAKMLHGAAEENMAPAYAGLIGVLNETAPIGMLTDALMKCAKFREKVIPNIAKQKILEFEKSQTNFVRNVNILYNGGIASKQKYNSIRSSLTMCLDETRVSKVHIQFMKNTAVPRLLTYKELLHRINQIDIGELSDARETLRGIDEECKFSGKYQDLLQLLFKMAQFYLSANNKRRDKFNWFGKQEGSFKVAIGGDGAPFGKDDQALAWVFSFLNCGQHVCSSAENVLLFGANCSEDCEPLYRYVTMLGDQMRRIEGNLYAIQVDGKEMIVSFQFELLPNDMKYLAFLARELSISSCYFSPFADIRKEDDNKVQGSFGSKPENTWHPWKYSERVRVVAAVEKRKVELSKSILKPATKREKITSFIAQQKSQQEFPPLVLLILKECAAELAPSITQLFNFSLAHGKLPSVWKSANVVPNHKSGERTLAENYRPVSLTSILVKSLERIVHKHVVKFLTHHRLLSESQHGFREARSCVTQLLQLLHSWYSSLEKGDSVDVFFLDFAKAFDRVSHHHLLYKLQCYGIQGQLFSWFHDYLSDRTQRVIIGGHSSEWMEVTSGVPQGSILGPFLFLLYINDFPLSVSCNTELFADDSVLYRKITTEDDCVKFQDDLLSAASWCDLWKVTLKSEKCKSLHVTKSKCPLVHQYVLNNDNLSIVNKHKHLGIWIESSLGWDSHINYIVGKANRVLGLIRRTFGSKDPVAVKTAYNVLVRPILEYACPVWNPHLVKHIHSIESIQRRATRLICGSVKSYSERLAELNWSTLELRRKYLCLVQLYKIIHGFSDVDYTRYIDLTGPTRTRRNHDFKIRPRAVRTNYFKFSFFNRYVNDWNSLPNTVMSASGLNAFKNRLLNYLCT